MASAVGATVAGGTGASTGAISCGSMIDVWEGQNEAVSWFFSGWFSLANFDKIDSSSASDKCAENELHDKYN